MGRRLVLLIAHMFEPFDGLAIERLLNRDVRHRRSWRGAMPMLLTRLEPHHIARPDLFDRLPVALNETTPRGDDENLAERVSMPGCARAGLEGDGIPGRSRWCSDTEEWIDADCAGEPIRGSFGRSLRTTTLDLHSVSLRSL